jgi:nucleoside-diphosphate-sugar epimerase
VPTASLRLFSVYGTRQRPDIALSRLAGQALRGGAFELYGDGAQTRDRTFVGDVVPAVRDAAVSEWMGVVNSPSTALRDGLRSMVDWARSEGAVGA